MKASEHSLVINYRIIGGVFVERTIKDILPAIQRNKEGIEEVIGKLNAALEKKKKEIAEFEAKHKIIRIWKSDDEVKDDSSRKEGSYQGLLIGPASSDAC